MVPSFPEFKTIDLADQVEIEKRASRFPPYSDYNFTSLWCWDVSEMLHVSELNDNLVIRFTDYLTQDPFYSLLGTSHVEDSAMELLSYSREKGVGHELRLVPEAVAQRIRPEDSFSITEDPDNHDYVFSVQEHARVAGAKYHKRRNLIKRFKETYQDSVRIELLDRNDSQTEQFVMDVCMKWKESRGKSDEETRDEFLAMRRLFLGKNSLRVNILGMYVSNEPLGFSIFEILHDKYAIIHFEKADPTYPGIYAFLLQNTSQVLEQMGCYFINYEQDLGIPGLKKAKLLHRPVSFLKKYIVKLKN